jgi:hypothetical protein
VYYPATVEGSGGTLPRHSAGLSCQSRCQRWGRVLPQVQARATGRSGASATECIMPVVGPAVRRGPQAGPALRCASVPSAHLHWPGVPATETGSELQVSISTTEKLEVTGPPGRRLSHSRSTKWGRPFLILSSSKRPFVLLCRLPPCILVPCTCALQTRRTPGMSFAFGAYPGAVLWRLCAAAR